MLRPPRSLLAALVATTLVVTLAVSWAGWRLLDQQGAIDDQRAWEQIETSADALAADVRGTLAETGERLSAWVADPAALPPVIDGAVVVAITAEQLLVAPAGGLPFVPVVAGQPATADLFSPIEAMEFDARRVASAADGYRRLTHHPDPRARAGAWLRLARVLRKSSDLRGALAAYVELAAMATLPIDEVPAELVGLNGQRVVARAMGDGERERRAAAQVLEGLGGGRWLITRGVAEFYREEAGASSRPEAWWLADALTDVWGDRRPGLIEGSVPARGLRVVRNGGGVVLVLWRSGGSRTALLATFPKVLLDPAASGAVAWQLADPEGQVIGGESAVPPRSVSRVIANTEYPWTLQVWPAGQPGSGTRTGRATLPATLPAMMAGMLAFVWGAAYFMGRAIRREAAVARLQSDFVAAVSHEFRSPLTTVRQMAEMLEMGRLPTEEKRQTYYRVIAGEAGRLQRLVETLLNFGRMEAGAERYRLVDVDVAALVHLVVRETEPQARESGTRVEASGPDADLRVLADEQALAVALRNLIENAVKYSPAHSTVWVRWSETHDRVAIAVVDRGPGIPAAEQQAVFRKFVRGRSAIDGHVKGTGVGLSMAQQIVRAHHGEIRLDSEPGRGCTFTLLLPLLAPGPESDAALLADARSVKPGA